MSSKINQQLIAEQLQLSRATVSRCFTNHPGINPVTRAKVFALAAKLGYNHLEKRAETRAARAAENDSPLIGVFICIELPNFDHTGYGNPGQELLNGLSEFARSTDARLDLHFIHPHDLQIHGRGYHLLLGRRRRWDGVVLIYPFPREVVEELLVRYPCVSLVEQQGEFSLNSVDVDHYRGVNKIIDHLRKQGHERIGFFTWRYPVEATWALRRYSAYVGKLTSLGLPVRESDVINASPVGALSVSEAHERAYQRIREGVTAWVCAADHQGYDLLRYLKKKGVRVPEHVSVTGFDGILGPADVPTLTTIQIPFHHIGLTGGKRLLDLLQKRFDPVQHILLDCELRPGGTVGPVPKKSGKGS
jgi:DNA-binding LacI/PurR family transcriptional regulator